MNIQTKNSSLHFEAGLTRQMKAQIYSCDANKIENYFIQQGINSNFKNNKIAAWCSLQCLKIIQEFNRKYNLNLGLPKGIFVEDFADLKIPDSNICAFGITNFAPAYLYKNKNSVIPEKTIFLNSENYIWQNLDTMSDEAFSEGLSTSDFFLENILHEFMHVVHICNMLSKIEGEKFLQNLKELQTPEYIAKFY